MPKLLLTDDADTYALEVGVVFRIGRHPENDLPLRESLVSRFHAEIRQEVDHYRLIDLDSLNGTYVNEKRVKNHPLKNGDMIRIGKSKLLWQDENAPEKQSAD